MVRLFHVNLHEKLRNPQLADDWPDDPDDPQGFPIPDDDSHWDVFLPDDGELDPLPEPGDFWIEPEDEHGAWERGAGSTRTER